MHRELEADKDTADRGSSCSIVDKHDGEDFLFLFDLLAHTCGLESTLRVLTHSDEKFHEICKPRFNILDHLELEEDKLKVSNLLKKICINLLYVVQFPGVLEACCN